jgi:alkanesulfonate monooxygenase SsuD/methylene tetrahydromethanopterin reductase-like flavin-dependent oxidoreductase (luciferase family)
VSRPAVGITLPAFVRDPDDVFAVARAAEAAELDGVFVYDHLFRVAADGTRRPALEMTALLHAVIAETRRVAVGVLVARAALRPAAVTALTFATAARVSEFGVGFGSFAERIADLGAAVRATRDAGVPVWVGGRHAEVRALAAAEADGWNCWGADPTRFAAEAAAVRAAATRAPFTCSWGGLVVIDASDADAGAKAERLGARPGTVVGGPATVAGALAGYVDAGAGWLVAGPVDPRNPANAAALAAVRDRLA